MQINADFSQPASLTPADHRWVPSPQPGVERVMLDRVGDEVARATSLVRYAPESVFPAHQHPGGEEILVLSGTFSDESQDFPAGWYLRNPPGSAHRPSSREGALIFVKLWQMTPAQSAVVRINTNDPASWRAQAGGDAICPLYSDDSETVRLHRLPSGHRLPMEDAAVGHEVLVIHGSLQHQGRIYGAHSWLRFPPGQTPVLMAGEADGAGTTVYVKISSPPPASS